MITDDAILMVTVELSHVRKKNRLLSSPHEGYAVLLEEVDELWTEVKKKRTDRDPIKMRAEACQIAAVAMRILIELT